MLGKLADDVPTGFANFGRLAIDLSMTTRILVRGFVAGNAMHFDSLCGATISVYLKRGIRDRKLKRVCFRILPQKGFTELDQPPDRHLVLQVSAGSRGSWITRFTVLDGNKLHAEIDGLKGGSSYAMSITYGGTDYYTGVGYRIAAE